MATEVHEAKELICELCRLFYDQGWVGGTGGGISVKAGDLIVMAPSGVQKERMLPTDMFVLDAEGGVVEEPVARPAPYKPPKLSECSPLFMAVSGAHAAAWHGALAGCWPSAAWQGGWLAVGRRSSCSSCRHAGRELHCTRTPAGAAIGQLARHKQRSTPRSHKRRVHGSAQHCRAA